MRTTGDLDGWRPVVPVTWGSNLIAGPANRVIATVQNGHQRPGARSESCTTSAWTRGWWTSAHPTGKPVGSSAL